MGRTGVWARAAVAAALLLSFALRAMAESGDVPYHERWAFPVLTFPAEAAVRMAAEEPACSGWVRPGGKSREAVSETGESVPASESAEREAFLPLVRSGQIGVGRERASGALFFSAGGRGEVSGLPGMSTGSFSGKGERARAQKKAGEQFRVSGFLKGVAAARNRSACGETKRMYPPHGDFLKRKSLRLPHAGRARARFLYKGAVGRAFLGKRKGSRPGRNAGRSGAVPAGKGVFCAAAGMRRAVPAEKQAAGTTEGGGKRMCCAPCAGA